jgi:two-component system, LytTR family, response regulator
LNIAIVDDARLARRELVGLLESYPAHRVVGEAANVADAIALLDEARPDLLLLDINLPDGTGFDVLERADFTPRVIFTTAYDQHALKAFEVNALDYLLKPVTAERFRLALARLASVEAEPVVPAAAPARFTGEHLFVRDGERCWFVQLRDLALLEVDGNYVTLHFRGTKALLSRSLNYLEARLDPQQFFRANRSQVVNLHHIAQIDPWIGDGLMVRMQDGREVEVSRRQARELKQRLEI